MARRKRLNILINKRAYRNLKAVAYAEKVSLEEMVEFLAMDAMRELEEQRVKNEAEGEDIIHIMLGDLPEYIRDEVLDRND